MADRAELAPAKAGATALSGVVADARGRTPAELRLQLRSLDAPESFVPVLDEGASGRAGRFRFEVPAGHYALVARAPGHVPALLADVPVSAGEELHGLALVLPDGLTLQGEVRDPEGAAKAEQPVVLEGEGFALETQTESDGRFRFEGLAPGRYRVRAFDPQEGSDEARAEAGGRSVTLTLGHRRVVRGRVRTASGEPVAGASVVPLEQDLLVTPTDPAGPLDAFTGHGGRGWGCAPSPSCLARAQTDEEGRFRLEVAADVAVRLAVIGGDLRAQGELAVGGSDEVELLAEPLLKLPVRTLDFEGKPVASRVQVRGAADSHDLFGTDVPTDPSGEGQLRLWPHAPVTVQPMYGVDLVFPVALPDWVQLRPARHIIPR
jgi:hypothetical protein